MPEVVIPEVENLSVLRVVSTCFLDEGQEHLVFAVNRSLASAGVQSRTELQEVRRPARQLNAHRQGSQPDWNGLSAEFACLHVTTTPAPN